MLTQFQMQVYFQFLAQALQNEYEKVAKLNEGDKVYVPHADRQRQIADDLYDLIDAQFAKLETKIKIEARDAKIHNDLVASGKLVEFPNGQPVA